MPLKSKTHFTLDYDVIFYADELEEVYDVRATMQAYAALMTQSPFVKWCRVNHDNSVTCQINPDADLEPYIVGYTPDNHPIYQVDIFERHSRLAAILDGAFAHESDILSTDCIMVPRRPFREN